MNVTLSIDISKEMTIKAVTIEYNDTGMKDDSELITRLAYTLLKSVDANKDELQLQDLLQDLDISKS